MKSVAPYTPYGYTIFCDDVRSEAGGKTSYMGIYRGKLILNAPLPASLPKFFLVIHYFERPDESTEPVNLHVYMPGDAEGAPTVATEVPLDDARSKASGPETPESDPVFGVISHLMIAPLELKSEGRIRVRAYRGDLEVRLGTLTIISKLEEDVAPKEAQPTTRKAKPKKAKSKKPKPKPKPKVKAKKPTARERARSKKST